MPKKTVERENVYILEDMTYELKKYSFALKTFLNFLHYTEDYEKHKNELCALLCDYSELIEVFSGELSKLSDCLIENKKMIIK